MQIATTCEYKFQADTEMILNGEDEAKKKVKINRETCIAKIRTKPANTADTHKTKN